VGVTDSAGSEFVHGLRNLHWIWPRLRATVVNACLSQTRKPLSEPVSGINRHGRASVGGRQRGAEE